MRSWQGSTKTRCSTAAAACNTPRTVLMSRAQAMSAFMFFSNANRERVKADNPGIAFGEVGRKLGELWRAATADEKKEYDEQAAADKVRAGLGTRTLHWIM